MVSKSRGVESGVIPEDVIRSIKTLEPLGAGYKDIDVESGKMVVKELDEGQGVVLAEVQAEDGKIVEETLVARRGWTRELVRAALENMLLCDGSIYRTGAMKRFIGSHQLCSGIDLLLLSRSLASVRSNLS